MALIDDHPRFEEIDDDKLEMIILGLVPKNTKKKSKKKCENCLVAYLKQKKKTRLIH